MRIFFGQSKTLSQHIFVPLYIQLNGFYGGTDNHSCSDTHWRYY